MSSIPRRACRVSFAIILVGTAIAHAQHAAPGGRPSYKAPAEARQFDFLIGHWDLEITVPPPSLAARIHGMPKLVGSWKAWRGLDGWGIEDELRITDEAGNPMSLAHALRAWDAAAGRWSYSTVDAYRARFTGGGAEWRGGEMHLTSTGTDLEGRAYSGRSRFFAIAPDSFRFQQDRSFDGGTTWTEGTLRITAKRVATTATR
jgi:hypothetical protein